VESLVDYHTLAIDRSIFVRGFDPSRPGGVDPFAPGDLGLHAHGTFDKLWINGHYYSDKPPVQAVLMAGAYQIWRWCGGAPARDRPAWFCSGMTLLTSGLS